MQVATSARGKDTDMSKVVLIGIDALDSTALGQLHDRLPNFSRMREDSVGIEFDGVFPPDSPTSWASIYSGLSPANHGIVLFADPLKRVSTMISEDVDDNTIRGKTFWDVAGRAGKRVCIIPHLLGYPPWDVNGLMIGRSGVTQDVQVRPESLREGCDLSKFKWNLALFPGSDRRGYLAKAEQQLNSEVEAGLSLLKSEEWDLFFISFGELDPIQYSFWNFYDRSDSAYPGPNQYEDVIPRFYEKFDEVIGRFLDSASPDSDFIVVSDHGIGARPSMLVNVNELLRLGGFLYSSQTTSGRTRRTLLKDSVLRAVDKYNLGNIAARLLRSFPWSKELFVSSHEIDWGRTEAYLLDQSGIKNYPYGGISLMNIDDERRSELVKNNIVQLLSGIRQPVETQKLFKWIVGREMIYSGEYIDRYPDILFELADGYGAGASVNSGVWGRSTTHRIAPGCHKQHNATFLVKLKSNRDISRTRMTLMDVSPTVLDLMGVERQGLYHDGGSILAPRADTSG